LVVLKAGFCVKKQCRLSGHHAFKRVWSDGLSVSFSFLVLVYTPNSLEQSRFGVVAGKPVGSAVLRNRAKRRIRASLHELFPRVKPGWDILIIARRQVNKVDFQVLTSSLTKLFKKADLIDGICPCN
jgi:ribonuclease P protein component